MDWLIGIAIVYLVLGVFKASAHLSSGRDGLKGPLATFITVTFLWPFI